VTALEVTNDAARRQPPRTPRGRRRRTADAPQFSGAAWRIPIPSARLHVGAFGTFPAFGASARRRVRHVAAFGAFCTSARSALLWHPCPVALAS
jgi:hypothetical protein